MCLLYTNTFFVKIPRECKKKNVRNTAAIQLNEASKLATQAAYGL